MLKKSLNFISTVKKFDYVIIGGGTAGCLMANRLSADPTIKVALLEAGSNDSYLSVKLPIGYLNCFANPKMDWCYKSATEKYLGNRSILYPRGRVLGGCSSINGMIYMRGQSHDYDGWASLLNDQQWKWQNCLPYFMKHEDYHSQKNQFHNKGGEWKVSKPRVQYEILNNIKRAFIEYGVPAVSDFNSGNNFGVNNFDVNQYNGRRCNASFAFLKNIKNRPNLQIFTNQNANKLIFQGNTNRIKGIETFSNNNQQFQFISERQTILSAGSIGSTAILQRSGIGGKWLQDEKLVKLRHYLNGVGQNLQDHLQIRLIYKAKDGDTLNTRTKDFIQLAKMGLQYAFNRSGPLSMAPSQLGAFVKSEIDSKWPLYQYHIQSLSLDAFGQPLHSFDAFTMSICNLRPTSRGHIRISSTNLNDHPKIWLNYLSTKEDQDRAVQSIKITRDIISQKQLRQFEPQQYMPGSKYTKYEDLVVQAGLCGTTIFHPVGTCKMGLDNDPNAVVNNRLKVFGLEGLRIVDASVMPKIVSGNTNSPTLMISEKASQWILKGQ